MARNETSTSSEGPSYQGPRFRPNWGAAVTCLIIGTYLSVALVDYEPAQSTITRTAPVA